MCHRVFLVAETKLPVLLSIEWKKSWHFGPGSGGSSFFRVLLFALALRVVALVGEVGASFGGPSASLAGLPASPSSVPPWPAPGDSARGAAVGALFARTLRVALEEEPACWLWGAAVAVVAPACPVEGGRWCAGGWF